jgi:hypothetical protein
MPPPVRVPLASNDQLNDLIDNADILDFRNDIESDIGSDLGFDSVSEFDISDVDEDDTGNDIGSDSGTNLDGKLDTDDKEGDIEVVQESDAAGSESVVNGDDIDSDNSDASSNFSYSTRSDVSGCSSCGRGEKMLSDDEADDEHFDLIGRWCKYWNTRNVNDDMLTAAENLQLSVTQLILRLGADPNATDWYGFTPLHLLAMDRGSVAQSRMLLDYGAHVHQTDSMNRTPLMHFQEWQRQLDNQGNPDLNLQVMIGSALPLPLSCLAAQVVSKHQIFPFDKEQVPSVLHSFTPTSLNYSDGYSE